MPTSRSTYRSGRRSSASSSRSNSRNSTWGGSYGSSSSSYGRSLYGSSSSTGRGSWSSAWSYSPSQFNEVCDEITERIGSYRNVYSQCKGPGKVTWFSPTTANRWVKMINDGNCVYKFSNPQFSRSFGSRFSNCSTSMAERMLRQKYGAGIKAVARGRGNCWLVACSSSVSARPFSSYNWS